MFLADYPKLSRRASKAEARYIEEGQIARQAGDKAAHRDGFEVIDRLIRARRTTPLVSARSVFLSPNLWGCALGYGLMTGLTYAIMTWVPTYLVEVKHYSIMEMGFVASAPWIGAVIGSVLGGVVSDRFFGQRRKPVMLIAAGASIFTMYGLIIAPAQPLALATMLLGTGILLFVGYSTFMVYPMGLTSRQRVPLALAIVSTMGAIGGGAAPMVVGFILDAYGWNAAFLFLSICAVVAFAVTALIIEPFSET